MHRFYDGYKEVDIPTAIEELTEDQYLYFLMISSVYATMHVIDERGYRVRWLSYLAGLENIDFTLLTADRREKYEGAMTMTDGFFDRNHQTGQLVPILSTVVNLLPEHEGYRGPGDFLEGVTFGEFTECLKVLAGVKGENEEETREASERIARVLYHIPDDKDVPEVLLFHAPTLFRSVLRQIESSPIEIDGEPIDFRIIFQSHKTGKNYDDKTGWTGITFEVASSGVFGGVKDVEKTDLWMVLLYLYRCKFEYLHSKRKGG